MSTTESTPQAHVWTDARDLGDWEYCQLCGVIRRADDQNPPCSGPVRFALRETDSPAPALAARRAGDGAP